MRGGKRLWARLLQLVASVTFGSFLIHLVFSAPAAHAANISATSSQVQNATYTWVNMATVSVKIGSNAPITFYDPNGVSHYTEAPQDNQSDNPYRYNATTCNGNQSTLWANAFYTSAADQNSFHAQIAYSESGSDGGGCVTADINTGSISIAKSGNASIMYTLSGKNITRADGDTGFSFVQNNSQYPNIYAKQNQEGNSCFDRIVIENQSDTAKNAVLYELTSGSGGDAPNDAAASGCVFSGDNADILTAGDGTDISTDAPGSGFYVHVGLNASSESSPSSTSGDTTSTGSGSSTAGQCNAGSAVSWFICGVIVDPLRHGIDEMARFMSNVLQTPTLSTTTQIYTVWQSFRDIADVLFVLAFMIAIFSTLISANIDAYTIKKVLPRLVAAAILVQFSFFIGQFALDVGNILGLGIQNVFDTILKGSGGFSFNAGGGASQTLTVAGALVGATIGGLALASISGVALLAAVIAILAVIFTLILRQVLLLLLIVVSPIAFVAWILPGTEKFFKMWYTNLIKLVLMFPMVMALFGAGQLFSTVGGTAGGPTTGIIQLIGFVIPLFLVPATFKGAGSLMSFTAGAATGFAAKRSKQLQGSQFAKGRAENRQLKATQTASNPDVSSFRRAIARQRGGFGVIPSAGAQRRLAGQAATLDKQRQEAYGRQFETMDDASLVKIASGEGGVAGVEQNESSMKAAITTLTKQSKFNELAQAREHYLTTKGSSPDTWRRLASSNAGDLISKAPDTYLGPSALDSLTAKQVLEMHKSTAGRVVGGVTSGAVSSTSLLAGLTQLRGDPASKAAWNSNVGRELLDTAAASNPALHAQLSAHLNADGTLI